MAERCCFCGKKIMFQDEHNARPLHEEVCCETCNFDIVIPERMRRIKNANKEK